VTVRAGMGAGYMDCHAIPWTSAPHEHGLADMQDPISYLLLREYSSDVRLARFRPTDSCSRVRLSR
jgi:hypothetical protein